MQTGPDASRKAGDKGGLRRRRRGATAAERPEFEEDDEERALWKELAVLACTQRKATLRVAERQKLVAILDGSAPAVSAPAVPTVVEVAAAGDGPESQVNR